MNSIPSEPQTSKATLFEESVPALRAVLNAAPHAQIVIDEHGKTILANSAAAALWGGNSAEDLIGNPVRNLFPPQYEFLQVQQAMNPEGITTRADALHQDGFIFPVSVTVTRFETMGRSFRMLTAISVRRGTAENLAEREELFRSLGHFSAGLAHEFNNVLTGIIGNLHLAMGDRARLQPGLLETAYQASLRARELTRELNDFGKGDRPRQVSMDLREMLQENSLIALSGSETRCDFDFEADLAPAFMDPTQIGKVMHHLLTLADDLVGQVGRVRISAINFSVDSEASTMDGILLVGDYVRVRLEMEHSRINSDDVSHLFEPYSRSSGRARGMSLAICHGIIHRHGGLLFANAPGRGQLQLDMFLPASAELPVDDYIPELKDGMPELVCSHILIMDDEQLVSKVLQRSLENMGHRCKVVSDGEEAVEAYLSALETGDRFDLGFLDLAMPEGISGQEVCSRILELDPLAACVVMSGDTNAEIMRHPSAYGFVAEMAKPFDLDSLMDRVDDLLSHGQDVDGLDRRTSVPEEEDEMDEAIALLSDNIVEFDFRQPPSGRLPDR